MKKIYTLGIDTSCDDTSVAVLENDKVLANVVSSQIDVHKEWGGVVPNLARREHERLIGGCIELALKRAGFLQSPLRLHAFARVLGSAAHEVLNGAASTRPARKSMLPFRLGSTPATSFGVLVKKLDAIAVTHGPGLAPALEVGVAWAKRIALENNLLLIAVNHMEGHTLSVFLKNKNGKNYSGLKQAKFPFLALNVSGGHTELAWVERLGEYKILGQTLDDAAGECFDKVARMLDLGYPGGELISKFAEGANRDKYPLPRPMLWSKDYNFSFSGLKTACLYNTNKLKEKLGKDFAKIIPDYCASVQEAIVDCLVIKTAKAVKEFKPKMLVLGGGVAANSRLRARIRKEAKNLGVPVYFPDKKFTSDNAAMIALAGYHKFLRGEFSDPKRLERVPSLRLG